MCDSTRSSRSTHSSRPPRIGCRSPQSSFAPPPPAHKAFASWSATRGDWAPRAPRGKREAHSGAQPASLAARRRRRRMVAKQWRRSCLRPPSTVRSSARCRCARSVTPLAPLPHSRAPTHRPSTGAWRQRRSARPSMEVRPYPAAPRVAAARPRGVRRRRWTRRSAGGCARERDGAASPRASVRAARRGVAAVTMASGGVVWAHARVPVRACACACACACVCAA